MPQPPELPDPGRLVFVGGLHRSGTTVLARVLGSHPECSGLTATGVSHDEGQHLQSVYPVGHDLGGPGRFAHRAEAHLTEESPLVGPGNAEAVLRSWTPYWDLRRHWLVEKSPPNLVMSRFLQALYPGCSFVFLVRHPMAVTFATRKWRKKVALPRLVANWFVAHRYLREDFPHLGRATVITYESLVADPGAALDRVGQMLGLGSAIDGSRIRADRSEGYADAWNAMRADPAEADTVATIVRRFGPAAAKWGYDIRDIDSWGPLPAKLR